MINFNRIDPDIFVGSAPQNKVDVERLKHMGITAVLSLQSDADLESYRIDWSKLLSAYQYSDIVAQRFPITDFDEVDLGNKLAQPVKTLNSLLKVGHRAYVHCNAGICRAPATVLGYFCHYRGMDYSQGLDYIRANRPQANPYKRAVEKALEELSAD